jgi:hypothetical protein
MLIGTLTLSPLFTKVLKITIHITAQLKGIGYIEATEENGLILQLKSYASCMIGKLSSEK